MDIGGVDVILAVRPGVPVLPSILRLVRAFWPDAMLEDAESGRRHSLGGEGAAREWAYREVFIYRDRSALAAWDLEGGTAENQDSMIHVTFGSRSEPYVEVTIVVGEMSPVMSRFIDDCRTILDSPHADELH